MNIRSLIAGLVLVLATVTAARADVVITVGSENIQQGHTAYVPVYINATSGTINLQNTSFELVITTSGSTELQFGNSPTPASDPTFTDSTYVFFTKSQDLASGTPLGDAGETTYPNDTFFGGDSTTSPSKVNVTVGTTPLLLGDIPVTTLTDLAPVIGDTFTISLVPTSGSGGDNFTAFGDNMGNFQNFTSVSGTETIVSPLPKPLAGSLGLLGMLGTLCWIRHRRVALGTA